MTSRSRYSSLEIDKYIGLNIKIAAGLTSYDTTLVRANYKIKRCVLIYRLKIIIFEKMNIGLVKRVLITVDRTEYLHII